MTDDVSGVLLLQTGQNHLQVQRAQKTTPAETTQSHVLRAYHNKHDHPGAMRSRGRQVTLIANCKCHAH